MSQLTHQNQIDGEPLVRQYLTSRSQQDKERVLSAFAPLVKYIIGRMNLPLNSVINRDDIYQFGILGLMDALEQNYLDKHDAVNRTADALVKAGIGVVCAWNLHK